MTTTGQRGYTLIEVLAAFAVLALALTVLLGALTNAGRQVRWSDDAGRAAVHARSLLDEHTSARALAPGRSEGRSDDGRIRWQLDISHWEDPDPVMQQRRLADPSTPRLLLLVLALQWGDGPREQLRLESLRLATPAGAGDGIDHGAAP
ncbi:MAG: prepilin-type N-terminal cleavage/methylation domain-containing protein [Pseudoxanthomonas suwonensis]|nr:prepilin-type N-terminal cleavage/methylation domain-containing protein [Pseudoxanthomonas suwonensis]